MDLRPRSPATEEMTASVPAWRCTQKLASQVSSETGAMKFGVDDLRGGVEVLLGPGLIAQDAVGKIRDIHSGQRVDGVGQQRRVLVGVVEVGDGGIDVAGAARPQVGGDCGQFLCVAGYEEEAGALRGPDAAGGLGDAGGCAEDENLARCLCRCRYYSVRAGLAFSARIGSVMEFAVTRSQKLEVSMGSR